MLQVLVGEVVIVASVDWVEGFSVSSVDCREGGQCCNCRLGEGVSVASVGWGGGQCCKC